MGRAFKMSKPRMSIGCSNFVSAHWRVRLCMSSTFGLFPERFRNKRAFTFHIKQAKSNKLHFDSMILYEEPNRDKANMRGMSRSPTTAQYAVRTWNCDSLEKYGNNCNNFGERTCARIAYKNRPAKKDRQQQVQWETSDTIFMWLQIHQSPNQKSYKPRLCIF